MNFINPKNVMRELSALGINTLIAAIAVWLVSLVVDYLPHEQIAQTAGMAAYLQATFSPGSQPVTTARYVHGAGLYVTITSAISFAFSTPWAGG